MVATFRYRVYEPETPRDLPLELVQEWTSPLQLEVGQEVELENSSARWRIATIADDPDPAFDGRVFFEVSATPPGEPPTQVPR
jgi:hypothetical protein